MLHYKDSDMFSYINKGNSFQKKLTSTIASISPDIIMNDKIGGSIEGMKKLYKETITVKVASAIEKGEIILINPVPDKAFPAYFPFVKAKLKGKECVIVDISRFITIETDADDKIIGYKADVMKLYNYTIPAYISLKMYGKGVTLPSETMTYLATLWARMFCNTLMNNSIGILQNHAERYEAFMYFAIRFFLTYYLEAPIGIVDKLSLAFLGDSKNEYVAFVESRIESLGINIYENFTTFTQSLFNNDITNIKGMGSKVNDMNQSQFLIMFRNQYSMNAIMALCSVDYFTFVIFNGYNKSNVVRDRGLETVIEGNKGEYKRYVPHLLGTIYKEI